MTFVLKLIDPCGEYEEVLYGPLRDNASNRHWAREVLRLYAIQAEQDPDIVMCLVVEEVVHASPRPSTSEA